MTIINRLIKTLLKAGHLKSDQVKSANFIETIARMMEKKGIDVFAFTKKHIYRDKEYKNP